MKMSLPNIAIDPCFALFGKPASYTPPSGPVVACTALLDHRRSPPEEFTSKPPSEGWTISVRVTELAQPVATGVFTITETGKKYVIVGKPSFEDSDQLIWICAVV